MASFNKVFIMGNLARDPDFRNTPNGSPVCKITVAVSRKNRDRDETCFVDVTVWGKPAENCRQYLSKGSAVLVEGYLKQDTWQDRNTGENRSKIGVVAENVQFMTSGKRDNNNNNRNNNRAAETGYDDRANYAPQPNYAPAPEPSQHDIDKANGYQPEGMVEEDIPF
jgi:single-strand DNA-binding protein